MSKFTLIDGASKTGAITNCPNCGEELIGDGYSYAIHCPNFLGELFEPDSDAAFCEGGEDD